MTWKQPIPVHVARSIAERYGYDQVIIIARKVDDDHGDGGEHCTTYGRNKAHCDVAAHCGDFLKHEVMKWHREPPTTLSPRDPADIKMIYGQCLEGLRVDHDCPATFALAAIMVEVMPPPSAGDPT